MLEKEFSFQELPTADLLVDAVYRGGVIGSAADDPLARLVPVGNQGGFRFYGKRAIPGCRLIVLFSTFTERDWPDHLDVETGEFTYYGDNRRPGHELHDTPRGGNLLLRACFGAIHSDPPRRAEIPPVLIFSRAGANRDVKFRGLAVPGATGLEASDDLVAIWRTSGDQRFQNYRAQFTVLDVPMIHRRWVADILGGAHDSANAPAAWRTWLTTGNRQALRAPRNRSYRSKAEQLPRSPEDATLVERIYKHFRDDPVLFEACAVELVRMLAPNIIDCDLTRPWVDGGRDAIGFYRIGPPADPIRVEFALEAKCYAMDHGVGVEDSSRLISRLRFRQFGILVTTSWVHHQAYREIRDDGHPVVIVSARDVVELIRRKGLSTEAELTRWLETRFSSTDPRRT
jgi:hypothetical protein